MQAALPRRRSLRLKDYDYTQSGAYFVTICAQRKSCLFGRIVNDAMQLNDAGEMIQQVWHELPSHYPGVDIDAFVVMPNHVHGIIVLESEPGQAPGAALTDQGSTMSLGDVVHRFKSLTTAQYRHGVKTKGWRTFPRQLWQRDYYEHVIRNEEELNRIRQYIIANPVQWALDRENPSGV